MLEPNGLQRYCLATVLKENPEAVAPGDLLLVQPGLASAHYLKFGSDGVSVPALVVEVDYPVIAQASQRSVSILIGGTLLSIRPNFWYVWRPPLQSAPRGAASSENNTKDTRNHRTQ